LSLSMDLFEVAQGLVLIFGLVVVYFAAKSYRRTKSQSMLLLTIGFAAISVGAVLGGIAFQLMGANLETAAAIQAWAQALGFFVIILSLAATKD